MLVLLLSSGPAKSGATGGLLLTSVVPSTGPTPGGTVLVLSGAFGSTNTVTVGGANCPVTVDGPGTIVCTSPPGQGVDQPVVVTSSALSSNVLLFSYSPPSLASINPSSGPTTGIGITLHGSNFGTASAVTVGGVSCPIVLQQHVKLICAGPPGQGTGLPVVVDAAGQTTQELHEFSYNAPAIASVSPGSGPTVGGTEITIAGSSFGTAATATVGGVACVPTQPQTHGSFFCSTPAGQGLGNAVVLTAGGQASNAAAFDYEGPVIDSILPGSRDTAGGSVITLTGSNFGSASAVTVGGNACPIVPPGQTQDTIPCALPSGQGSAVPVVVTVSGQASPPVPLAYDPPQVAGVTPLNGATGGNYPITLTGSNFGNASAVTIGSNNCAVTVQSHDSVTCTAPAGEGTGLAVSIDAGGQSGSSATPFSYNPPSISTVTHATAPTLGGTTLTLQGSNFGTASTVSVGGQNCNVISQGHTTVRCTVPPGQGAALPVILTTGGQISNSGAFSYAMPVISNVQPASGPVDGGIPITINGSNFGTSSLVTVGGSSCPVTGQTHLSVVCDLPPGAAGEQVLEVDVGGQIAGSTFLYLLPTPTPTPTATATYTATATPIPACDPAPRPDCRAAAKSVLVMKDNANNDRSDSLVWKWLKGELTEVAALGQPQSTTTYALCLYADSALFSDNEIAPGGSCNSSPCWAASDSPFKFKDRSGAGDGITKVVLKAGTAGKAKMLVKGKGTELPDPALPPTMPVTVQLVNGDGECWSATYSDPPLKSESSKFKAVYKAP